MIMLSAPSLPLVPALVLALLASPGEPKLKESDHKVLSKGIAAYFTARDEEKGIIEALQDALEQIQTVEKKLKGAKLLASVADWEQVFRLVTQEHLAETLKKRGEVASDKRKVGTVEVSFAYCCPKKMPKSALPLVLIACDSGEVPSAHLNTHWNDPALRES